MDSYREHPNDFHLPSTSESAPSEQAGIEIGSDERRMHVRAYNYWVSLLNGRDYPSIEDLEPAEVEDFASNSVLLDFTARREHPATPYIGEAIRQECGLDEDIKSISEVPSRSLLSRLTDHYLQIIANRAPIGFEAEFVNQRGEPICYRGILMPFSSDGDMIDFIYGVINWKRAEEPAAQPIAADLPQVEGEEAEIGVDVVEGFSDGDDALTSEETLAPVESDEFVPDETVAEASVYPESDDAPEQSPPPVHFSWEDGPLHDPDSDEPLPPIHLDEDAGLADRLWAARESADAVKAADSRSRTALYRALSYAYDFALASHRDRDDYAELLAESGVKAQVRAPMTPIVKLVFGIDYDKARLTEFAAALSYACRQGIEHGGFEKFIESHTGGLKTLVAAERKARRPEPKPDTRAETARAKLREAAPLSLGSVAAESEFALVLARRRADGGVEPIALVDDEAMVERAIRRVTQ